MISKMITNVACKDFRKRGIEFIIGPLFFFSNNVFIDIIHRPHNYSFEVYSSSVLICSQYYGLILTNFRIFSSTIKKSIICPSPWITVLCVLINAFSRWNVKLSAIIVSDLTLFPMLFLNSSLLFIECSRFSFFFLCLSFLPSYLQMFLLLNWVKLFALCFSHLVWNKCHFLDSINLSS